MCVLLRWTEGLGSGCALNPRTEMTTFNLPLFLSLAIFPRERFYEAEVLPNSHVNCRNQLEWEDQTSSTTVDEGEHGCSHDGVREKKSSILQVILPKRWLPFPSGRCPVPSKPNGTTFGNTPKFVKHADRLPNPRHWSSFRYSLRRPCWRNLYGNRLEEFSSLKSLEQAVPRSWVEWRHTDVDSANEKKNCQLRFGKMEARWSISSWSMPQKKVAKE